MCPFSKIAKNENHSTLMNTCHLFYNYKNRHHPSLCTSVLEKNFSNDLVERRDCSAVTSKTRMKPMAPLKKAVVRLRNRS